MDWLMDVKPSAEQVEERMLSVNLPEGEMQQDDIIMTANHRSQCQSHLQLENASLKKPWI